jgi:hypothetical protein
VKLIRLDSIEIGDLMGDLIYLGPTYMDPICMVCFVKGVVAEEEKRSQPRLGIEYECNQ